MMICDQGEIYSPFEISELFLIVSRHIAFMIVVAGRRVFFQYFLLLFFFGFGLKESRRHRTAGVCLSAMMLSVITLNMLYTCHLLQL